MTELTMTPLIEARMQATEHHRRARAYELAGDDDAAKHERILAAWFDDKVRKLST